MIYDFGALIPASRQAISIRKLSGRCKVGQHANSARDEGTTRVRQGYDHISFGRVNGLGIEFHLPRGSYLAKVRASNNVGWELHHLLLPIDLLQVGSHRIDQESLLRHLTLVLVTRFTTPSTLPPALSQLRSSVP